MDALRKLKAQKLKLLSAMPQAEATVMLLSPMCIQNSRTDQYLQDRQAIHRMIDGHAHINTEVKDDTFFEATNENSFLEDNCFYK